MSLGESGTRLWHALGMGPLWRDRAAWARVPEPGAVALTGPETATVPVAGLDWEPLEAAVAQCTACGLCRTRQQTVFAAGRRDARWLFVGEAPGAEEDARGEPFVGQAGRLLDSMLAAIDLDRNPDAGAVPGRAPVYIANVVKCRPPGNRNPAPAEMAACLPFLRRQIELLQPRLIVVMGRIAVQALLATEASIAALRGRVHELALGERRYPVIVTYHPAYLLRTPADKAKSWEDLCLARATYANLSATA